MNLAQLLSIRPLVMGVMNVSFDSFFDGGRYSDQKSILDRVEQMLFEGADIIDIGGYSSRPSASNISEEEELSRLEPALELVLKYFPSAIISVDTFRAGIAKKMIDNYNVAIINDISGGSLDENMFRVISEYKDVYYVLMHMRGNPQNMQHEKNVTYKDIVADVLDCLNAKRGKLNNLGFSNIIIDPGFGFAKTLEQNYELLKHLAVFCDTKMPVLVGMSRKSMLCKVLECTPDDCLNATTVVNTMALMNGASILRVHDVKEAVECVKIFQKYNLSV